jgi:hypothetical protein
MAPVDVANRLVALAGTEKTLTFPSMLPAHPGPVFWSCSVSKQTWSEHISATSDTPGVPESNTKPGNDAGAAVAPTTTTFAVDVAVTGPDPLHPLSKPASARVNSIATDRTIAVCPERG